MSTVIRSLMIKVGADLTGIQKGLKQASKDLKKAGKEISSVGSSLTKGITVPIVGAVAGLTGLAVSASNTADELITMSNQLGISTDTLQKLQYAARFVDVSVEDMAKGMAKTTKATGAAVAKGQDYIEIADGLTVSTRDANGNLKDSEQIFYDAVDALGSITDETQREIAAQNLFGKSYQDIMPLIQAGSGALKSYGEEAEKVGAVLDEKTVNSLGSFNDWLEKTKATIGAGGAKIATAFLPVLEKITPIIDEKIVPAITWFADKISNLITWFDGLDPKMQTWILRIGGMVIAAGPALNIIGGLTTKLGGFIGGIGDAVKIIQGGGGMISALSAIVGPAGIALAAIAAIATAAFLIYDNWGSIKEFFSGIFAGIKETLTTACTWVKEKIDKFTAPIKEAINLINGAFTKAKNALTSTSSGTSPTASTRSPRNNAEYATGTNYVPMTGMALLHQGEVVIPRDKANEGYTGGGVTINITGNKISNDYDVDRIGDQLVKKLKLAGVKV